MKHLFLALAAALCMAFGSAASAADEIRELGFVLAHNANEGSGYDLCARKIAELMARYSGGKMTVEVHGSGALGAEPETLESIRNGSIDMAIVSPANLAKYSPVQQIFTLPYLIKDYDHVRRVMDSDVPDVLVKDAYENAGSVVMKPFLVDGFRIFFNNTKEIKLPSDLAGMKFRTPGWPILIETMKLFGANPVSMDFGEVYLAISSGTVDGAETLANTLLAGKFDEVAKYVSKDFHQYSPTYLNVAPSVYEDLNPAEKAVFDRAAKEGIEYSIDWNIENDAGFYAEMAKRGMTVTEVDLDAWAKAAAPVYEQFRDEIDQDLLKKIQALR